MVEIFGVEWDHMSARKQREIIRRSMIFEDFISKNMLKFWNLVTWDIAKGNDLFEEILEVTNELNGNDTVHGGESCDIPSPAVPKAHL